MGYEMVIYEKRDQVAYVTFNRPQQLNAYGNKMMQELEEIWRDFGSDPDMRVAIITGKGRGFCAGWDVKEGAAGIPDLSGIAKFTPRRAEVFKPVICAVNGICAGGGFRFILESDLPICSEEATFTDPHTSLGFVSQPEVVVLSRFIGYFQALRVGLVGRYERISAQRAYEMGLVTEVVPADQLQARAQELAEKVRQNAPLALSGTIEAMWRGANLGLENAVRLSDKIARWNAMTEDYREGPRAFAEKRQPQWKGR
ncbi:MAG: enoyl-CoA hydratase/isomerase family protein [Chloroflexi bacterium]|nr:enoyl-CoA hydratase/isomerase family protein [Chloroflexota bacterium]